MYYTLIIEYSLYALRTFHILRAPRTIAREQAMKTIKSLIFMLCDRYGDQTSIAFLAGKLKPLMLREQNKIINRQKKLIALTGLTPEEFFESEELLVSRGQRHIMVEVILLSGVWGRLSDVETSSKGISYSRGLWRKSKKVKRDCRRYKGGQPKRNMVKV